jgi:hypothetical protein
MNTTLKWMTYAVIPGFFLAVCFGVWLGINGKPYATALFTVHKLLGAGTIALLVYVCQIIHPEAGSLFLGILFIVAALVLVGTGAAMSILKMPSGILRSTHIFATFMLLLSGVPWLLALLKK